MKIRSFVNDEDYTYLEKWVKDERIHALWCANIIPFPVTKEGLHTALAQGELQWGDCACMVTEDNDKPVGFFAYSRVNVLDNSCFLRFVVLDKELRGKGYGTKMLRFILNHIYCVTGAQSVQLNVFDVNIAARTCYEKAGFVETSREENAFSYQGEHWGRCRMKCLRFLSENVN